MIQAHLQYVPLTFTVLFERPVVYDTPPLFIIRSLLGAHLHDICCIARNAKCQTCEHNSSCIYAKVFETIIDKDNPQYNGRDRAPHPFLISTDDWNNPSPHRLQFTIFLLGGAIDYAPYIFGAIERGQTRGFGKERIPYAIEALQSQGEALMDEQGTLQYKGHISSWTTSHEQPSSEHANRILIKLQSPLRYKHQGSYQSSITAQSLFSCFYRRMETLCVFYGAFQSARDDTASVVEVVEQNTEWKDYAHYSARQRRAMYLGGIMGDLTLEGALSPAEMDLLSFSELFHAGKNSSFGFGKFSTWRNLYI